uniref:DNA-3-methyladenine glycosylase I n=1 Tax=Hordeum vulgare subsp. vulgare TaxID=112509 RepID=A0A8I6XRF4_HORVV
MCNSNVKSSGVAQIDGRPVLQPAGNRVAAPEGAKPLKKSLQKSLSMPASYDNAAAAATCTAAPKSTGASDLARAAAATPCLLPPTPAKAAGAKLAGARAAAAMGAEKNRKQAAKKSGAVLPVVTFAALEAFELAGPAGSIAAAQREHVTQAQAQRKMRIAHYGRTASFSRVEGKVGADWASILRRRHIYREAFSGFDVDAVAKYTEKQMASLSAGYGLDLGTIRGAVNNACRILEVRRDFGSFGKYVWGFVNHKPLSPGYKYSRKIPVKTSKSESISKDMVRRGFRFVGPTVLHSFMQAVGLTNDHLVSCPRHRVCSSSASA